MIEQAIRDAGSDWRFLTFEVAPGQFADAMRGVRALGFRGVKIVDPHREAVLEFVDELAAHARLAGSVNCVIRRADRLVGDNTIGQGLVNCLRPHLDLQGKHATVLGLGRAARPIVAALSLAGTASITLVGRDASACEALIRQQDQDGSAKFSCVAWPQGNLTVEPSTDLLVNATPLGSDEHELPLPIDANEIPQSMIVADASYNPPDTWLLREAVQRGLTTVDGLSILVEQTALALEAWSGIQADRDTMREAAEEYLGV